MENWIGDTSAPVMIPGTCFSVQAIKSPALEGHFSYKTSYTFKTGKNRNRNRPIIQSGILSFSDLFYSVLFWAFKNK